jgi:hypothetical protein
MLHILNGESVAPTLGQATIPGEMFCFRDALMCGPAPAGLLQEDWRRIRAYHLSEDYQVSVEDCEKRLLEQDEALSDFSRHDEIVLWFEHDLFCQINLLYLLDWFARNQLGPTRLSLINIGTFPGKENFRGLGELNAEELASLFPKRELVTPGELDLGAAAFRAYTSTDPTAIEAILDSDTSHLPFLDTSLRVHLRRFPWRQNGLGLIENRALELISQGFHRFPELFSRFGAVEPAYGMGDAQFWNMLNGLSNVRVPLVSLDGKKNGALDSESMQSLKVHLTDTGSAVLKGDQDFVRLNGIDRWLGGVHLAGRDNLWRWDSQTGKLAFQ